MSPEQKAKNLLSNLNVNLISEDFNPNLTEIQKKVEELKAYLQAFINLYTDEKVEIEFNVKGTNRFNQGQFTIVKSTGVKEAEARAEQLYGLKNCSAYPWSVVK